MKGSICIFCAFGIPQYACVVCGKKVIMKYNVMVPSAEEYAKADQDPNYVPAEHKVGEIETATEVMAKAILKKYIQLGKYPKGSQLILSE